MNTNPNAKKILCYGDSNTYGRIPGAERRRYPTNVRWTGVLQGLLGGDYEVIEEGLGGRTTVIDDGDGSARNGLKYLLPCIESHAPIDFFVVCLGTNDLKERFALSAEQIAANFERLLSEAMRKFKDEQGRIPEVIVMAPPLVDESVPTTQERYIGAEAKSNQLGELYQRLATKYEAKFLDLAQLVIPSKDDGYHLDEASHRKVAEELAGKIL
jgi:lysophospholipase L1-like esterase